MLEDLIVILMEKKRFLCMLIWIQITKADIDERFAVIDNSLVWHGGMNLLGKEDAWDNLMLINNPEVAAELLEIELANA